jgi:hypothetical protein
MNIINNKIKDNYATLKMQIKKNDIGKDIIILNQCWIYKLFKNFELEDIEVEINGEHIPIKYKHVGYDSDCTDYNSRCYSYRLSMIKIFTLPLHVDECESQLYSNISG